MISGQITIADIRLLRKLPQYKNDIYLKSQSSKIWGKKIGNIVIINYILENWCVSRIADKLSQNETQISQIQLMSYMSVLQKPRFFCRLTTQEVHLVPLYLLTREIDFEGTQQKASS